MSHGTSAPAVAQHQAIVAIGGAIRRQALIIGFSDTFAVIGALLALAAVALLFARKVAGSGGGH
jgi:DHA2 family multidrug resistance protein